MKYLVLALALPFLQNADCGRSKKDNVNPGNALDAAPPCVKSFVTEKGKNKLDRPPMQIDEYEFNSKTVFLVTAPCCDQFNVVYDDNCQVICAPSGGFAGSGDGKCKDFAKMAQFVKTIWKDSTESKPLQNK